MNFQFEGNSSGKPRVVSLFSGCGGMDFGIEAAGGEIVFANDIHVDAAATLRKYFPNCDVRQGNIAAIDNFPHADVVVGGYPCQSFSMAGNRAPASDRRSTLYQQFVRVLRKVRPLYFVAENVSGLKHLKNGFFLAQQVREFSDEGYHVDFKLVDAADFGVPQHRKRLFIVGTRKKLRQTFTFPPATHGSSSALEPYQSHGDVINGLPSWPEGEFYERPNDPDGNFSWYYMSRNRKAKWDGPAYTVVANWRHITLHPASPKMEMVWSNLKDGWKQKWRFSSDYDHLAESATRVSLERPRRLSWRECALIQTFADGFEPAGDVESKFMQVGNAVPPLLAQTLFQHLFSGSGLTRRPTYR